MRFVRIVGLGVAFLAAFSFPASAQLSCASRKAVTEQLARGHGERLNASGTTASGALVELYEAPGGRSWTLVLALPDGRACLIAAGREWRPRQGSSPLRGKGA